MTLNCFHVTFTLCCDEPVHLMILQLQEQFNKEGQSSLRFLIWGQGLRSRLFKLNGPLPFSLPFKEGLDEQFKGQFRGVPFLFFF